MHRVTAYLRRHAHPFGFLLALAALGLGFLVYREVTPTPTVAVVHAATCPQGLAAAAPIVVSSGKSFTAMLDANHTTILHWALVAPPDSSIAQLGNYTYYMDHVTGPRTFAGVGGVEGWTFRAVGPGCTTLRFSTVELAATPTARDEASPKVTVLVTVTPN